MGLLSFLGMEGTGGLLERVPDCTIEVELVAELGAEHHPASLTQPAVVDVARLSESGWVVLDPDGVGLLSYSFDGDFLGPLLRIGEGFGRSWVWEAPKPELSR